MGLHKDYKKMIFVDKKTGRQAAVERRKPQRTGRPLDRGNCNKILDITIYNTSL
jgi:hypothetical protein